MSIEGRRQDVADRWVQSSGEPWRRRRDEEGERREHRRSSRTPSVSVWRSIDDPPPRTAGSVAQRSKPTLSTRRLAAARCLTISAIGSASTFSGPSAAMRGWIGRPALTGYS